jgi:hypothetical protein
MAVRVNIVAIVVKIVFRLSCCAILLWCSYHLYLFLKETDILMSAFTQGLLAGTKVEVSSTLLPNSEVFSQLPQWPSYYFMGLVALPLLLALFFVCPRKPFKGRYGPRVATFLLFNFSHICVAVVLFFILPKLINFSSIFVDSFNTLFSNALFVPSFAFVVPLLWACFAMLLLGTLLFLFQHKHGLSLSCGAFLLWVLTLWLFIIAARDFGNSTLLPLLYFIDGNTLITGAINWVNRVTFVLFTLMLSYAFIVIILFLSTFKSVIQHHRQWKIEKID